MKYFNELKRTMAWVAEQERTMFVGQTVAGPGTFMYKTLEDIPKEKALEMPINESFQMQFTIGLALAGYIPISVYPRQNFLLIATADMVNMLDKIPAISSNKLVPKVIIRVASGPAGVLLRSVLFAKNSFLSLLRLNATGVGPNRGSVSGKKLSRVTSPTAAISTL